MIPTDMARDATESGAEPRDSDPGAWTVLYDRDCGFCRCSLAALLALDRERRLRPVALGTGEADALLGDVDPQPRAASWHLVSPRGWRWSAGAAAPPLLRLLAGGRAPAAVLQAAPELTERTYRWVADHRSIFSKAIPGRPRERADARIERHAEAAVRDATAAHDVPAGQTTATLTTR